MEYDPAHPPEKVVERLARDLAEYLIAHPEKFTKFEDLQEMLIDAEALKGRTQEREENQS